MAKKKTIHIRFIEHGVAKKSYTIERKTFFGWRSYRYLMGGGAGDYVSYEYTDKNKFKLLDTVIRKKLMTTQEFIYVIEHPMIKKY